jgi:hypothetical protein
MVDCPYAVVLSQLAFIATMAAITVYLLALGREAWLLVHPKRSRQTRREAHGALRPQQHTALSWPTGAVAT